MTNEEIREKINDLKGSQFLLMMKDNWSPQDFETDRYYTYRIKELQKELEENT